MSILKTIIKEKKWRKKNKHNFTKLGNVDLSAFDLIQIGNMTYGTINVYSYGNRHSKLIIGSCCSISTEVRFILAGEHDYNKISTFPFKFWERREIENLTKGDIIIEDDVWIGMNVTIMSGVHIHQGAVIGAGAVIFKDVPAYAIVGINGVIKYRFPIDTIQKLSKLDYSKINKENVSEFENDLYLSIEEFLNTETYKLLSR